MKNHRIFKKNREYDQDEYIRLLYLTSMCVCAYPHACVPTKSLQYCQLCDPMDCSPPLSVGFSRPECQGGLPSPPPGDPPDSGVEPVSPVASALQVDSLPLSHNREPMYPHINKQFLDWYQPGVESSTQFWHSPPGDWIKITQGKGSCQVHALLQTPTASPGYLYFWLKSVLQRFPWSLPWVGLIC